MSIPLDDLLRKVRNLPVVQPPDPPMLAAFGGVTALGVALFTVDLVPATVIIVGMIALVTAWLTERIRTAQVATAVSMAWMVADPVHARMPCPLRPDPRNVRIHKPDGSFIPLELTYSGHLDGVDHWRVTNLPPGQIADLERNQDWHLDAEFMPKPCAIGFGDMLV